MTTRRQFTSNALRALALLGLILTLAVTALTTTPAHAANAPTDAAPRPAGVLKLVAQDAMTGEGLAASVYVWTQRGTLVFKGLTNTKGYFEAKLTQGVYKLEVYRPDYESYRETFKIADRETTYVQAPMQSNERLGAFSLYAGDPVKGTPIAGASVTIWSLSGGIIIEGETNVAGEYKAELPAGSYELRVAAVGYKVFEQGFKMQGDVDIEAMLEAVAQPEGVLIMQVVDAVGKGPIYAANVGIYDTSGQLLKEGLTGKDGTFMVSLPDGLYVVVVSTKGYSTYKDKIEVTSRSDTFLEVLMVPEGR